MKIKRNCVICNNVFYAEVSEINRGRAFACSSACRYKRHSQLMKGHKMKPSTKIKLIKALTGKKRSKIQRENSSKSRIGKYIGNRNGNWKGGKYLSQGRWHIRASQHPYRRQNGYILNARFVVEKTLSRYLTNKEKIHHINLLTNDDNPNNLYLFSSNSKHTTYHQLFKSGKIKPITESNLSNY